MVESTAHTEVPAAAPAVLGIFNAPVIVAIAMVVVLIILAYKKVPAAIGKSLDTKIAAIRAQLDEATALRAEAEALKVEYEAKAKAADADAAAMVERAHAEALIVRRQAMAEAKIAAEERSAIDALRATTAQAATTAAAKLIGERNDAANDSKLVDQAIAGL